MLGLYLFLALLFLALGGLFRARQRAVRARVLDAAGGALQAPSGPDEALCRYCSALAVCRTPRIEHVRSPLDPMWRALGLVPVVRWTVALDPMMAPQDLCELHGYRARTLLEREIADAMVARAEWSDRQTKHLIEYQSRGLHDRLLEDCAPQRKVRGAGKPPAPVTQLREVKRPAGSGEG